MKHHLEERSEKQIVAVRIEETVTEADFEALVDEMEATIDEFGSVRLYVEFEGIPRAELEALDDDLKFWLEHRDDLERYAVVSDNTLTEWLTELGDHLTGVDVEYFDIDERDAAWEWTREEIES